MTSPEPRIIKPGPSLVQASRALERRERGAGAWPYQWLYPGPNSRQVLATAQIPSPHPGVAITPIGLGYQVPEGLRFSLRGIVFGFAGTGWVEASGALLFTLQITSSGGMRNVDFLANIATRLGSSALPYPILGRLEFDSLDVLNPLVLNVSVPFLATNFVFAHLVGHTYPNSEAV